VPISRRSNSSPSTLFLDELFDLAARGCETLAHDGRQVFVQFALARLANRSELVFRWDRHVYAHAKRTARALVPLRRLNGNTAADHMGTDLFKLGSLLANERLDGSVFLYVAKSHC
jgi:hypothetical protein